MQSLSQHNQERRRIKMSPVSLKGEDHQHKHGPTGSFLSLIPLISSLSHCSNSALLMTISSCWGGREAFIRYQCPEYNTDTVLVKVSTAVKR